MELLFAILVFVQVFAATLPSLQNQLKFLLQCNFIELRARHDFYLLSKGAWSID